MIMGRFGRYLFRTTHDHDLSLPGVLVSGGGTGSVGRGRPCGSWLAPGTREAGLGKGRARGVGFTVW